MKSKFLKKIIAMAVITTSLSTVLPMKAFGYGPENYYNWQFAYENNGYWKLNSGKWNFYNNSGILQKGWILNNGKWYFADFNGEMQTGIIQIDGNIYIFAQNGEMQVGRAIYNGQYYSIDCNGVILGDNLPMPNKGFDAHGTSTMAYVPDQIINDEHSSPSDPVTEANDPKNPVKFTIKFKDEDGDSLRTKTFEKNERIKLYTPKKDGYEFTGWSTKKNGNGHNYDVSEYIVVKEDMTLYAMWDEVSEEEVKEENKTLVEQIIVSGKNDINNITTNKGTLQMTAKVLPVDADDTSVTWSIGGGTGKASISSSGLLTAEGDGNITVIATADDGSKIEGKTTIRITGQTSSGSGSESGNGSGSESGNENGGNSGTGSGNGGTTTKPIEISVLEAVPIDDVNVESDKHIVDLSLLKNSGLLPKEVTLRYTGSDKMVLKIADWKLVGNSFNSSQGGFNILEAVYDIPTDKYKLKDGVTKPKITIKVTNLQAQTDAREEIVGASEFAAIKLTTDEHLTNLDALKASLKLPKEVNLTTSGNNTVKGTITDWQVVDNRNVFNGLKAGTYILQAKYSLPAGYKLGDKLTTNPAAKISIEVSTLQTKVVSSIEITQQPKLEYFVYNKLDLSDLKVKLHYNDGTISEEIPYDEFANNNPKITVSNYLNGQELDNKYVNKNKKIIVNCSDKSVGTDELKVATSQNPTIEKSTQIFDKNDTGDNSVVFKFTSGTGYNEVKSIKVFNGTKELITTEGPDENGKIKDKECNIDISNNTITILSSYLKKDDISTGSLELKVHFYNSEDKEIVSKTCIISIKNSKVKVAPDNNIKLEKGTIDKNTKLTIEDTNNSLEKANYRATELEYVVTDEILTSASAPAKWTTYLGPVEVLAEENQYVNIRKKAELNGVPSEISSKQIDDSNIAHISSLNTIKTIKFKDSDGKIYEGKIDGRNITVIAYVSKDSNNIVDTTKEVDISNLILEDIKYDTNDLEEEKKVKLKINDVDQTGGLTTIDYSNSITRPIECVVTAENGRLETYKIRVFAVKPQKVDVHPNKKVVETEIQSKLKTDKYGKPIDINGKPTENKDEYVYENVEVKVTKDIIFNKLYTDSGIDLILINSGVASITLRNPLNEKHFDGLEQIDKYTSLGDKNPSGYINVGVIFKDTPVGATKVKIASSIERLESSNEVIDLQSDLVYSYNKQSYMKYVPIAKRISTADGKGIWGYLYDDMNIQPEILYYAWLDERGKILGYSQLTTKVGQNSN